MVLNNYTINEDTLAILPFDKKNSIVYENNQTILISKRPNRIIEYNCSMSGSSMQGRLDNTEYLTGLVYKAPILVKEKGRIVFFPTSSPRLRKCCWINLNNISFASYNDDKKVSVIHFFNNICIDLDVSFNIINNQILKASRLESILLKKQA